MYCSYNIRYLGPDTLPKFGWPLYLYWSRVPRRVLDQNWQWDANNTEHQRRI